MTHLRQNEAYGKLFSSHHDSLFKSEHNLVATPRWCAENRFISWPHNDTAMLLGAITMDMAYTVAQWVAPFPCSKKVKSSNPGLGILAWLFALSISMMPCDGMAIYPGCACWLLEVTLTPLLIKPPSLFTCFLFSLFPWGGIQIRRN